MGWRELLEGKDGKERIVTYKSNNMETKFYVGQKVKDEVRFNGITGKVEAIRGNNVFPVLVDFDGSKFSYTHDGIYPDGCYQSLFPVDPEPFRLTEWQRIKLNDHFLLGYKYASQGMDWYALAKDNLAKIESILSDPEPPKYQPKQGDAVLVRAKNPPDTWKARIATGGNLFEVYSDEYGTSIWDECRPFDPALVGKVTD